ncbi:single-stranded DNA-binding protein [Gulosibacter hominis]|uniref:single-stranded DNA-binding protein n=1 Tax=Gulosibacter hominis TaxID=2770504 RepID=UPI0019180D28|nr:single-stranded DNA-binding protein [Gulosibacter hominis]
MSTITRTGNLARTPELRYDKDGKPYAFARVLVTDRIREGEEFIDGGTIAYDVAVNGVEAEQLVDAAERCGNIRVWFTGPYRVREWTNDHGETRLVHEVRNANIAVSLRGQRVTVERATGNDAD